MSSIEYSAFLSYSRDDEVIGAKIEKDLQKYRIPSEYRPDARKARFNIFRDVHDVELGEYNEVIDKALQASKFLIILCSPSSRNSDYVTDEIKNFVKFHDRDHVIPVLVYGAPNKEVEPDDQNQNQAFPDILYDYFEEPIAADFRPKKGEGYFSKRRCEREAFFQIVAKLLGQPKSDKLVQRDRRKRQLIFALSAIIITLGGSFGGWYLYDRMPKSGLDPVWSLTKSDHNELTKAGLKRITQTLGAEVPEKDSADQILIATWNIRRFAANSSSPSYRRSTEALAYIALIISYFDIVALQELTGVATEFETAKQKLLDRLGPHWQYAGSGVTEGKVGNRERLGFLFDTRSVQRTGDFDEIVLPAEVMKSVQLERQIARTPLIAGFMKGGHKVSLTNAHIYYGGMMGEKRQERLKEFTALVKYLRTVQKRRGFSSDYLILLGDLNFDRPNAPEASVAIEAGFTFPKDLLKAPSNYNMTHPYDQIILSWNSDFEGPCVNSAGVFKVFDSVYREGDIEIYTPIMEVEFAGSEGKSLQNRIGPLRYFKRWRTFKMSDHYPKWIALDFGCR